MNSDTQGWVYLLHYEDSMSHAQHYLGWTNDLQLRLAFHRQGDRSRCVITSEFAAEGIRR